MTPMGDFLLLAAIAAGGVLILIGALCLVSVTGGGREAGPFRRAAHRRLPAPLRSCTALHSPRTAYRGICLGNTW